MYISKKKAKLLNLYSQVCLSLKIVSISLIFTQVISACSSNHPVVVSAELLSRLDTFAKSYGTIRYFHPWVVRGDIQIDSTSIEAIQLILNGGSAQQALALIVNHIKDPATSLDIAKADRFTDTAAWKEKSNVIRQLLKSVDPASESIIDLRNFGSKISPEQSEDSLISILEEFDLKLELPASRANVYLGYPSQSNIGSPMYKVITSSDPFKKVDNRGHLPLPKNLTFLVDSSSYGVDRVLGALMQRGLIKVRNEGSTPSETGLYEVQRAVGHLRLRMRLSEPYFSDGSLLKQGKVSEPQEYAGSVQFVDTAFYNESEVGSALATYALIKTWTIIDLFYPYKQLLDSPWSDVLKELMKESIAVQNWSEYVKMLQHFASRVQDNHCTLTSARLEEARGFYKLPISLDYVNDTLRVSDRKGPSFLPDSLMGAELATVNGVVTKSLIDSLRVNSSYSTEVGLRMRLVESVSRQKDSTATLGLKTLNGSTVKFSVKCVRLRIDLADSAREFYWQNDSTLYLNLVKIHPTLIQDLAPEIGRAKHILVDLRGYPQGGMWPLVSLLATKPYPAYRHRSLVLWNPDSINSSWAERVDSVFPTSSGSKAEVWVLIDGNAISQSEHSALLIEHREKTHIIGERTVGANGDITSMKLPGQVILLFTGLGISHSDGRELQRVGVVPEIEIPKSTFHTESLRSVQLRKSIDYIIHRRP
jgi:hypothetical protein